MLKVTMEQVENCGGFFISMLSTFSLISNWRIEEVSNFLFYYFIFDLILFKKKLDIIIHHVIVLCMYSNNFIFSMTNEDFIKLYKIIILAEVSSIFLLTKKLISDKKYTYFDKIRPVNDFLFISTFLYFRIFHYYFYLLRPNQISDDVLQNYSKDKITKFFYWANIYSFFALNLYWTLLIFNKLLGSFKDRHITSQSMIKNEKLYE